MGRKKGEGPKQLTRVIDNPRFVRVFATKGNSQLIVNISATSYDLIASGFERRGYTVDKDQS